MTEYNPQTHHRHSIRLQGYDYAHAGAYFVTICVAEKQYLLGEIQNGEMLLSWQGRAAVACWQWLAQHYPYIELDTWVVMPNHLHGILVIHDAMDALGRGASRSAPTLADSSLVPKRKTLGCLIGAFKTTSTKAINEFYHSHGERFWQRNFYEHIIRNEADLNRIREYIPYNPARWESDEYYAK